MSIGLLGLLYGMTLFSKIDGSLYHSKKFTNNEEQAYTVQALSSGKSVPVYYADASSSSGVTKADSLSIPASQTSTVYYNINNKLTDWKVTYPGYTFTFSYNGKEDIIDPASKIQNSTLASRSIQYSNLDDEDNGDDSITIAINQNDSSKSNSFVLYNGKKTEYYYFVGKDPKNGISNIQIKDSTQAVKNTLSYGGHFDEVHVYKINGDYIIQCVGNLDKGDPAITIPLYQMVVNTAGISILVEALDSNGNVINPTDTKKALYKPVTVDSGKAPIKWSLNNSVALDSSTAARSVRYSVANNSSYTKAVVSLGSSDDFALPHVANLSKNGSDIQVVFSDYAGNSIKDSTGKPITATLKLTSSATKALTIVNNTQIPFSITSSSSTTPTTFGSKGDTTAQQTIQYVPGTPITVNAANLAVTIDPSEYAIGSKINVNGANNLLFISDGDTNAWEILAMSPDVLPLASTFVNTPGTNSVTLQNNAAQSMTVGIVKYSGNLQSVFGNFVTVPGNGTVTLNYNSTDFAFDNNKPSGFVVYPGLGYGVGLLDSAYLKTKDSAGKDVYASTIVFDSTADGIAPKIGDLQFGAIPRSNKTASWYSVTPGAATLSLVDTSYTASTPYGKKYVTASFTSGTSVMSGVLVPADANGNPSVAFPVPDGLQEILTYLDTATCNALIKATLGAGNLDVVNALAAQGVKAGGSYTGTAWVYSIHQAYWYQVVPGASLALDAGALSGTLTSPDSTTQHVFIAKIADYDSTHHRIVNLDAGTLAALKAANASNTLVQALTEDDYAVYGQQ